MQGRIIKGISGFYYVFVAESGIYECKAKGIFRNQKIKPLVGDHVEIDVLDEENKLGNIFAILERTNELIRPAVANIDLILLIFSISHPEPNFNLLDRFLVQMHALEVPVILCFNKCDLQTEQEQEKIKSLYINTNYTILFVSAKNKIGIENLKERLTGMTAAVAGPSGVGKSSIINLLQEEVEMETGAISKKIERGKHTTRHSQIIPIKENTYIMDTPGFSSFSPSDMEKEELCYCYPEFLEYIDQCRFRGCIHVNEPDCAVKQAVKQGAISTMRYENYKQILQEIIDKKKY